MRVVGHVEEQTFRVVDVISPNAGALRVRTIGVRIAVPDVVGGEGTTVVEVRLEPRQIVANEKQVSKHGRSPPFALDRFNEATQHLVTMRIVRRRFGERGLSFLVVGENQPEVVSLHADVARSDLAARPRRDLREQSAALIARPDANVELMILVLWAHSGE